MKLSNLEKTIEETKRFLERAVLLQAAHNHPERQYIDGNPIEQGAVRRASMDLTRALAKLRNERC